MLTYEEAKKIGVNACVEKLGRDFVKKHENGACAGYGDEQDYAFCYVGVNDQPEPPLEKVMVTLYDGPDAKFPYIASCRVDYHDGKVTFLECVLPTAIE